MSISPNREPTEKELREFVIVVHAQFLESPRIKGIITGFGPIEFLVYNDYDYEDAIKAYYPYEEDALTALAGDFETLTKWQEARR